MEITKAQEINLVNAIKSHRSAKARVEAAQRDAYAKLEKLKECCQGNGPEAQVYATAFELLANCHIQRADEIEAMEG